MSAALYLGEAAALLALVLLVGLVVLVRGLRLEVADLRAALARQASEERELARRSASELGRQIHEQASEHRRELAAVADYLVAELRPVRATRPAPDGER